MPEKSQIRKGSAPVYIIRPAFKNFGLDYLHISLIALVVILVALAFALSAFKPGVVIQNCAYGAVNGTCVMPRHNGTQALAAASRALASYATVNTSLSLLPYYALINRSTAAYLLGQGEWFVTIPSRNPFDNTLFNFSVLLYDSNLSLAYSYYPAIKPVLYTNDTVVAPGVVGMYGKSLCTTSEPVPVYAITDPYATGAMPALYAALNATERYGTAINMSYYFIFGGSAIRFYGGYGQDTTQLLGRYLSCASKQSAGSFRAFLSNLSIAYMGVPLYNNTLYDVAQGSSLNMSSFGACMTDSVSSLNRQAQLASFYNIIATPEFVLNCKYATIPQTLDAAINYSVNQVKG